MTQKRDEGQAKLRGTCVLIVPLNEWRSSVFLTRSVKACLSITQDCESLIGNVGGEHISKAKVFSVSS